MQKKLKKVDELQTQRQLMVETIQKNFELKIQAMNDAYKSGDGQKVDKANKELFELLEPLKKDNIAYYTQMKNHTWQMNHLKILATISNLMQEKGRMPTNTEISLNAGLSDETTYKHLREFKEHDLYKHEAEKMYMMKDKILSKVFSLGVQGDVRACKVFLDYVATNTNQPPAPPTNNYIQINNLKITTDELEKLPAATLQKIETLIKTPAKTKIEVLK